MKQRRSFRTNDRHAERREESLFDPSRKIWRVQRRPYAATSSAVAITSRWPTCRSPRTLLHPRCNHLCLFAAETPCCESKKEITRLRYSTGSVPNPPVCNAPATRHNSFVPAAARKIISECRQGSTTSAPSQISSNGKARAFTAFSGETSPAGNPASRSPR